MIANLQIFRMTCRKVRKVYTVKKFIHDYNSRTMYDYSNRLRISSYIRKPFLIYDFAPRLFLFVRKIFFSFLTV